MNYKNNKIRMDKSKLIIHQNNIIIYLQQYNQLLYQILEWDKNMNFF